MTARKIVIGETSSFRYIGIEPPLNDLEAGRIVKRIALPEGILRIDYEHQKVEIIQNIRNLVTTSAIYLNRLAPLHLLIPGFSYVR